jgi:hypothetical protein
MNAAICFFSYAGDAALLDMALQAVPRLRQQGHNVDVYLCNDAAAPLVHIPSGCRVWQTTFDRKGNLNGAECICGMVDVYNSIFQNGIYEWILKTDCDTFINSLDWLHGVSSRTHAFAGTIHVNDHCSGACYAVSRNGAEWLQSRLQEPSWRGAAERGFCEDKVLYNMCKLSGMQVHALRANDKPDGMLWHDWQGEPLPFSELQKAYAIDFKACRWNSRNENWEADKQRAIERMKNYIESLKK